MSESKVKTVYLSGPISGLPTEVAKENFANAKAICEREGWRVINPMELPDDHDKSWLSYMRECIKELVHCDAIVMMPGAMFSKGAMLENNIAISLGLEIATLPELDYNDDEYDALCEE